MKIFLILITVLFPALTFGQSISWRSINTNQFSGNSSTLLNIKDGALLTNAILTGVTTASSINSTGFHAYGVSWNGSTRLATENDIYDEIETIVAGSYSLTMSNTTLVSLNGNDSTGVAGNWAKPFRNIDAAVTNSFPGMTVVVLPGTYTNLNRIALSNNVNFKFIGASTVIFTNSTDGMFTDRGSTQAYNVFIDAPQTDFLSTNDYVVDTSQASSVSGRTLRMKFKTMWSRLDTIAVYGNGVTNYFEGSPGSRIVSQDGNSGGIAFLGSGTSHVEVSDTTVESHTSSNADALLTAASNYLKAVNVQWLSTVTDTIGMDGGTVELYDCDIGCAGTGGANALTIRASTVILRMFNCRIWSTADETADITGGSKVFAWSCDWTNRISTGTALITSSSTTRVYLYGGSVGSGSSGTDLESGATDSIQVSGTAYTESKTSGSIVRMDAGLAMDNIFTGGSNHFTGDIGIAGTFSVGQLDVNGDLIVGGIVIGNGSGLTNVLAQNIVLQTNSTTSIPDFGKPYSLFTTNANFAFLTPINFNAGRTNVNRVTQFVTNSLGSTITATAPAGYTMLGNPVITNVSEFVWTMYPLVTSNVMAIPIR